ncbi:MAG: hypothetical protein K0R87_3087 [Pseudonocardia sp.]|nr:hypothetical protein [Pseudonocardia sp.]
MYARSTTLRARPDRLEAGICYIRDEVMPRVLAADGCIGLSLLVDPISGRCIETVAWESLDAWRVASEVVRPVANRAAELLGGTPDVEEWEIAVLHRDHSSSSGACVRTVWVRVEPDQVERAIENYRAALLPEIETFDGFCSASLMVDRPAGYVVSSVTFDSYEAMRHTRKLAAVVREDVTHEASGEVVEVGEFELALAHLRVPEMA